MWPIIGELAVKKNGAPVKLDGFAALYSNFATWTVNEYTIEKLSKKDYAASAKWYVDLNDPEYKYTNVEMTPELKLFSIALWKLPYYDEKLDTYWVQIDATATSKNPLQYNSYFWWEVSRDYWKNHPNMKMRLTYTVADGSYLGWCWKNSPYIIYPSHIGTYTNTKKDSLKLEWPPHTAADKTNFEFTSEGASAQSFTLFAEDDWELSTSANWLHFTSTSGSKREQILFDVDENTETSPREAVVTITSGRDTVNLTVRQAGK